MKHRFPGHTPVSLILQVPPGALELVSNTLLGDAGGAGPRELNDYRSELKTWGGDISLAFYILL